jgi:hypothetical protein
MGKRAILRFAGIIVAATLVPCTLSLAQDGWASSCQPPLKLAAGACVTQCPGGYADDGRVCRFRNQSNG